MSTNRYLLERQGAEDEARDGSVIVAPSFVAADATIENSVIGPFASIGPGVTVRDSLVRDSIVEEGAEIRDALLDGSIVGRRASVSGSPAGSISAMTRWSAHDDRRPTTRAAGWSWR